MTTPNEQSPDVLEIRRYSNRRFYDPSRSTHVTLEEIRALVQAGRNVRITEAKTGEDITSRVLTQIVLDYDEGKVAALPADILHRLIRSSESLWVDLIERYVQNTSRLLEDSRQAASEQWHRVEGMAELPNELARWWQGAMGALSTPWAPPSPRAAESPPSAAASAESPPSPKPDSDPPPEGDLRGVIDDLRAQLDLVQADLKALQNGPESGSGGPDQS